MKANELKAIYDKLNAASKAKIENDLKAHIIYALAYFYEEAQVGDNPLDLDKPIPYDDYEITGIEMMFHSNPKGEMVFHQQVKSQPSEVATNPLEILTMEKLFALMDAFEQQDFVYDEAFDFSKVK
jgi:hypothetical protein